MFWFEYPSSIENNLKKRGFISAMVELKPGFHFWNWYYRDNGTFGDDVARYIQDYLKKNAVELRDGQEYIERYGYSRETNPMFYYKGSTIEASHIGSDHATQLKIWSNSEKKCKSLLEELLTAAENKTASKGMRVRRKIPREGGYETPEYMKKYR